MMEEPSHVHSLMQTKICQLSKSLYAKTHDSKLEVQPLHVEQSVLLPGNIGGLKSQLDSFCLAAFDRHS